MTTLSTDVVDVKFERADFPCYHPEPSEERIYRDAMGYLVFKWQLFAHMIYSDMNLEYSEFVPVAGTDSKTIFLNPQGFIDEGITDGFTSFFKRQMFFRLRKVTVGGQSMSLSAYENDVIRPLGEPRVHFALNCMVRSCPRLPQTAFSAEELEAQLEAAAKEFLNDPRNVRVDGPARQVWLSAILDFYTEDFAPDGKRESLIEYVNRYRDERIDPSFVVKFLTYDWTLNRQP